MGTSLLHFLLLLTLCLFSIPTSTSTSTSTSAHNITAILSAFPEYKSFNSYLSQTKLSDDINNRQPVTVLALTDAAVSTLVSNHPISVVKHALSLHVLLDYFDGPKLHKLSEGSVLSTTLYQTTGTSQGQLGFVNITDRKGGKVCFGSGVPGSPLNSTYTKEVKKFPYSLSIVEISQPIIAPGIMTAPAPSASDVNITALLIHAGCKTFAGYIASTGVIKTYQTAASRALTVFAPSDEAFKAAGVPDISKLTNAELVSLLQYHALPSYAPIGTLKSTKAPLTTLATNGVGKYDLTVMTAGDDVTLHAGLDSSRVAITVIDTTPLCVFTVDSVLLPAELFGTAPAGEPVASPSTAPAPVAEVPGPATVPAPSLSLPAESPAPSLSPPAGSPAGSSPAEGPSEAAKITSNNSSPRVANALTLVKVAATVICSLFLS